MVLQVAVYGFNERLGLVSFPPSQNQEFQKPYGEATARMIDEEVRKIVDEAYARTEALLLERKSEVETVAQLLLDKEKISAQDVQDAIGDRPFEMKGGFQFPGEDVDADGAQDGDVQGTVQNEEQPAADDNEQQGVAGIPPMFAAQGIAPQQSRSG